MAGSRWTMNNNVTFAILTSLQHKVAKQRQIVFYKNIATVNVATYNVHANVCMGVVPTMLSESFKHNKSKESNQSNVHG